MVYGRIICINKRFFGEMCRSATASLVAPDGQHKSRGTEAPIERTSAFHVN